MRDLALLGGVGVLLSVAAWMADPTEWLQRALQRYEGYHVGEGLFVLAGLCISSLILLLYRWRADRHRIADLEEARAALQERAERFRSLIDHLPVGVYRSTREGHLLEANPAMARMLGFENVDELQARRVQELYRDEAERAKHMRRLSTDRTQEADLALRRADGEVVWVQDHLRAFEDPSGRLTSDGVIIDISERKRAEKALRESEERYRLLVEQFPEPFVVHCEGHIVYANEAAAGVTGAASPESLLRKRVIDFVHPDDREVVEARMQATLEGQGDLDVLEERLVRLNGETFYAEVSSTRIMYEGKPALQVVLRDITERKRYEERLVEAKEQAEELARLKSTFLANISHEVRTPLSSILGVASVLEEELGGQKNELIQLIRQSGERLLETLNSVLDLARLEANAVTLEPALLDVACEVEDTAQLFRAAAKEKGLEFRVETPAHEVVAHLDRTCLHRALSNLLSNAVKFTESGEVGIQLETTDEEMHIEIRDTGAGIDDAFLPYLFDEFKQESAGLARTHQGSGLGLAITKRLVEMMHGRIDVQSRKGEGSVFTLTFPYNASETKETMEVERSS